MVHIIAKQDMKIVLGNYNTKVGNEETAQLYNIEEI